MNIVQRHPEDGMPKCKVISDSVLRKGKKVNLLPGRVINLHLDPLTQQEYPQEIKSHRDSLAGFGVGFVKAFISKNFATP